MHRSRILLIALTVVLTASNLLAQGGGGGRGGHRGRGGPGMDNLNGNAQANAINLQNAAANNQNAAAMNQGNNRNGASLDELARMLISNFDTDNSSSLDATELRNALSALRDMMQNQMSNIQQNGGGMAAANMQNAQNAAANQQFNGGGAMELRNPPGRGGGRRGGP